MRLGEILKAAKVPLYFTSIAPVITAWALARELNWIVYIVLATVILMQATLNTAMDYYDFISGRHLMNSDTLFPLGSYFIEKMRIDPEKILLASRILLVLSVASGLLVVYITRNLNLLWIGIIAIIFALIYVIPPIRLGSRGIGEISTFVDFGIFPFIGTLIALRANIGIDDFLLASAFGILASMIRYLHHIPEDNDSGIRVRKFKVIYLGMIIAFFLVVLPLMNFLFIDILMLIILIFHWYNAGNDKLRISRRTNEIVSIDIFFTLLMIINIIF